MKYFPAKIIISILLFLLFSGCTSIPEKELPQKDELTKFFTVCESDIKKAVDVIKKHKIVDNLNHLLIMDAGGKKYYLLERENISEMIQSVTEGTYSDLILLNNKGTVIYTMENNDIFGKNVRLDSVESPLYKCFINSSKGGLYIEDISIFPPSTENKSLLVSFPDIAEGHTRGIFIIQINYEIIEKVFIRKIEIIGRDGLYRVCSTRENILTPYPYMNNINLTESGSSRMERFSCGGKICSLYMFKFSTLDWTVIFPSQ